MNALGLEYLERGAAGANEYSSFVTQSPRDLIAITGYTCAIRLSSWSVHDSLAVGDGYMLRRSADSTSLQLFRGASVALTIPLQASADRAAAFRRTNGNITTPPEMMRIEAGNGSAAALVQLTMIAGMKRADGPWITSLAGELFLRLTP